MTLLNWLWDNWFALLQSVGIVGGLIYTGRVVHTDAKVRRVQNLFSLTRQHREIWSMLFEHPGLGRVLEPKLDLSKEPITREEKLFVTFLIFHLSNSYRANLAGFFVSPESLSKDIHAFFSLPIPAAIWKRTKALQDQDFVSFVESSLTNPPHIR
jgi:hypothetical protein